MREDCNFIVRWSGTEFENKSLLTFLANKMHIKVSHVQKVRESRHFHTFTMRNHMSCEATSAAVVPVCACACVCACPCVCCMYACAGVSNSVRGSVSANCVCDCCKEAAAEREGDTEACCEAEATENAECIACAAERAACVCA